MTLTPRAAAYWRNGPKEQDFTRPHFIYRAFDSYGHLLYVGCSMNVTKRLQSHRSQAPWFRYAETIAVAGPWDRTEALRREREAIETEGTYFNSSVASMKRTQANIVAARKALVERGDREPSFDLDRYDVEGDAYYAPHETASQGWRRRHAAERQRLKESGRFPFTTDAERLGAYLAAREDAELARTEQAAA